MQHERHAKACCHKKTADGIGRQMIEALFVEELLNCERLY
jgi:hypothetical protein